MSEDLSKQKRGTPLSPSEGESKTHNPQRPNQQKQGAQEGEYRNIETAVNNPSYFDDDYAVEQGNEILREEARTEKADRPDKRKRKQ